MLGNCPKNVYVFSPATETAAQDKWHGYFILQGNSLKCCPTDLCLTHVFPHCDFTLHYELQLISRTDFEISEGLQ